MSHNLVVVYSGGPGEAAIAQGALQAAGIPSQLSREGAGAAIGFTVGPLGTVDVLVPEAQAAEARDVLQTLRGDADDTPGEESAST